MWKSLGAPDTVNHSRGIWRGRAQFSHAPTTAGQTFSLVWSAAGHWSARRGTHSAQKSSHGALGRERRFPRPGAKLLSHLAWADRHQISRHAIVIVKATLLFVKGLSVAAPLLPLLLMRRSKRIHPSMSQGAWRSCTTSSKAASPNRQPTAFPVEVLGGVA